MNNPVISQINQVLDCTDDFPYTDLPALIEHLNDKDGFVRMQVREILSCMGGSIIPDLVKKLSTADTQQRWEIIKVLECIQDPSSARILVEQLKDDHAGVRWAASNALIGLGRDAIRPLLEALTRDFDSLWLRQSAHHILHVFKDDGTLSETEEKVFQALEDIEPAVSVPWAANKALQSLRNTNKMPSS